MPAILARMATSFGNRPCVDPAALLSTCRDQGLPTDWFGRANLYRNPLGRGPGAGGILLTGADLDALDLAADQDLVFADDAGNAVTLGRITLLKAKCLSPGYAGDPRAVYLCDVADRRHFLARVPIDRAYNLKNADGSGYLSGSLNSGSAWTWAGVVQDVWTALGLGTAPALPFTPDGTPENLKYHGGDAWEAANDVLDRLACSVFYDPTADTFAFVRLGDATAAGATALTALRSQLDRDGLKLWDAYWREPDRGRLPEKVRVLFPRRPLPADGSSPFYTTDVTLSPTTTGVAAGSYVQLHDDLTAVGSGTPTNAAALATRAAERAADWRKKRVGYERRLTLVYRDFRGTLGPGELVAAGALDDRGGPMATELDAGPDGAAERWRPWEPPVTFGGDGTDGDGSSADPCSKLAGLRKDECVEVRTLGGRIAAGTTFGGAWDGTAGGWVGDTFLTTADGDTLVTLVEDEWGRQVLKLEGETQTWYAHPTGRCLTGGYTEFVARFTPPALENHWSGSAGESGDCTDHTFRLGVKCQSCLVHPSCTTHTYTVPRVLKVSFTNFRETIGGGYGATCPPYAVRATIRYDGGTGQWSGPAEVSTDGGATWIAHGTVTFAAPTGPTCDNAGGSWTAGALAIGDWGVDLTPDPGTAVPATGTGGTLAETDPIFCTDPADDGKARTFDVSVTDGTEG